MHRENHLRHAWAELWSSSFECGILLSRPSRSEERRYLLQQRGQYSGHLSLLDFGDLLTVTAEPTGPTDPAGLFIDDHAM